MKQLEADRIGTRRCSHRPREDSRRGRRGRTPAPSERSRPHRVAAASRASPAGCCPVRPVHPTSLETTVAVLRTGPSRRRRGARRAEATAERRDLVRRALGDGATRSELAPEARRSERSRSAPRAAPCRALRPRRRLGGRGTPPSSPSKSASHFDRRSKTTLDERRPRRRPRTSTTRTTRTQRRVARFEDEDEPSSERARRRLRTCQPPTRPTLDELRRGADLRRAPRAAADVAARRRRRRR